MTDMTDSATPRAAAAPLPDASRHGHVSTAYVRVLEELVQERGETVTQHPALLALKERLGDAVVMPMPAWREVLQAVSSAWQRPDLGLMIGRHIRIHHLGLFGYVLQSCLTLGAAMERLQRYERLINDINPLQRLHRHEGDTDWLVLHWGTDHGRPGPLVDECAVATLVQCARLLTGALEAPVQVQFVNPAPADVAPYTAFFGVTPTFSGTDTEVRIPAVVLDLPLRQPDPQLLGLLERQIDQLMAQLPVVDSDIGTMRRWLAQALRQQRATLPALAEALHVSERTLHRRLQQAGLNFRELLERTRQHVAEEYLRDPRLTLSDIADLLGYAEQSAFTRAFTRQTGMSPARWRRRYQL